ncbi:MAG TPA: hypothetical protein VIO33_08780 [Burkholderiaceae bacterium]
MDTINKTAPRPTRTQQHDLDHDLDTPPTPSISAPDTHSAGGPSSDHRARYLVLYGAAEAPRAALFDIHERLLAEMVDADDDYMVDNLVRASTACAPPRPAMLDAIEAVDRDADLAGARCFHLG